MNPTMDVKFVSSEGDSVTISMPMYLCRGFSRVIYDTLGNMGETPQLELSYPTHILSMLMEFVNRGMEPFPDCVGEALTNPKPIDHEEMEREFMNTPPDLEFWLGVARTPEERRDLNLLANYLDMYYLLHLGSHLLADMFMDHRMEDGKMVRDVLPVETIKQQWADRIRVTTGKDIYNLGQDDIDAVLHEFPWLAERNFPISAPISAQPSQSTSQHPLSRMEQKKERAREEKKKKMEERMEE